MRIFEIPQLAAASVASGATAIAIRDMGVVFSFLPSLGVLLAAFAGAGLMLSFLPPTSVGWLRALGTIVFCTLLGWLGAPFAVKWATSQAEAFSGAYLLAAFISAAICQALIPLFVDHRAQIVARLVSLIPGTGGDK